MCKFCKKEFSNKYTLSRHQKTTKQCIKFQVITNRCDICLKLFETTIDLKTHLTTTYCATINNKINRLEEQVRTLQKNIINLASKPKTTKTYITNNNNIRFQNMVPLTLIKNDIKNKIENNFTYEHFIDGQKGVANFAFEHILPDINGKCRYICTDPTRQVFCYKDIDGNINKDIKSSQLLGVIGDIKQKSKRIHQMKVKDADKDTERIQVYNKVLLDIIDMYQGNSNGFLRHLSVLTINDNILRLTESITENQSQVETSTKVEEIEDDENEYIILSDSDDE